MVTRDGTQMIPEHRVRPVDDQREPKGEHSKASGPRECEVTCEAPESETETLTVHAHLRQRCMHT